MVVVHARVLRAALSNFSRIASSPEPSPQQRDDSRPPPQLSPPPQAPPQLLACSVLVDDGDVEGDQRAREAQEVGEHPGRGDLEASPRTLEHHGDVVVTAR